VLTGESRAVVARRLTCLTSLIAVLALVACAGGRAPSFPLADRQIAVLQVDSGPDWLTAGFGSVWVKRDSGDVLRIHPSSHEILATIKIDTPPFGLCQGIGADTRSIWSCSESESDIVRIDPTTNAADVVVIRARSSLRAGSSPRRARSGS
jgi:hypothetical protein